jgi:hypothetical protein
MVMVVKGICSNIVFAFYLFLMFCSFTACLGANSFGVEENVSLKQIAWCNKQVAMVFMDDRAPAAKSTSLERNNADRLGPATGTPVALKDWNTLKAHLGFSVFLPAELPAGSCLLSASGSVRNAVSGSNFTLTYLLSDQTSLTLTQVPQSDKEMPLQCSAMPGITASGSVTSVQGKGTPTAGVQLCTGTRGKTNITFSVNWNEQKLRQFFEDLQPDENWMPHT